MQDLPSSEFWEFSLDIYNRPEVSKLCLDLQDNYGADVNMILFACWLGHTGRGRVSVSAWRAMILRLNKWRDDVIKPLRRVRHILRHEQLAPKGMKEQVFNCEIDAEHVEQLVLEREWGATRRSLITGSSHRVQDIIENLVAYLKAENIQLDQKLSYRCERLVKLVSGLQDDRFIHQNCYQAMGLDLGLGQDPGPVNSRASRANLTMP